MKLLPKASKVGFALYGGNNNGFFETETEKDAFINVYGVSYFKGFDSFVLIRDSRDTYIIYFQKEDLV